MEGRYKGQFWRTLVVVLSSLLVLSVCATLGFADQMEPLSAEGTKNEKPVLGTQNAVYTITVNNKTADHGTVTTSVNDESVSQAAEGVTVTVVATPADPEQYTLDELTVTKNGDPSTTVNVNYNNTFTMPAYGVTVTASFREQHVHDGIEFEPWKSTDDRPLPDHPGFYYLTDDVTLTNTWKVPCGGDIPTHLCLNGHSITLSQSGEDSQPVIRVKEDDNGVPSKFVLYDNGENKGAIGHAENRKGSGVWVDKGSTFVMKGGVITNNDADSYGGGVFVGSGGSFTMEGGAITLNTAAYGGGGVAVEGGTFTLTDGAIQDNGGNSILYGGGVCVRGGIFNLAGGTITSNKAARGGGVAGIMMDDGTAAYQIHLSGNPKVTDNRAERENYSNMGDNLCLMWPKTGDVPVTIDNTLGEDAKIGISLVQDTSFSESFGSSFKYTDGVFTTGYKAAQSTDPWKHFIVDNPDAHEYQVLWTPDGTEAQLAVARRITVDQGITGGTVTPSRDFAAEGETIGIKATPNEGWELVSVTAKDASGKDVQVTNNKELVVRASDVVVSATFKEKPTPPAPSKPTKPADPSQPAQPADPSQPSDPSQPAQPTDPTNPTNPSQPADPTTPSNPPAPSVPTDIHVTYTAHVQGKGDLPAASDGEAVGTTGESRRMEAISATVDAGGIEYRVHLQKKGWGDWVVDGKQAGTTGESRRLEAVQMRLTGSPAADGHHVWYRVHSQTYGWLGWACDGEPAGTAGMSKRAEAYQVLVLKGGAKPADYDASNPAYRAQVDANAHLQGSGWTGNISAGTVGTTGQSRRMEALRLDAAGAPFAGGITYQVHEQGNGWTAERSDGDMAGTEGESRRIEAVRIRLSGEQADHLSVWYRVHSQTNGWLGWAHDGADAGTTGLSKRAEAIEVQVLPTGQQPSDYDESQAACVSSQQ